MNTTRQKLPPALERLWYHLNCHCKGNGLADTASTLARKLDISEREIRSMTGELIELGYPVVSSCEPPRGIFVAVTREEIDRYKAQLKSRIVKTAERLRGLGETLTDQDIEQLKTGKIPQQLEMFSGGAKN